MHKTIILILLFLFTTNITNAQEYYFYYQVKYKKNIPDKIFTEDMLLISDGNSSRFSSVKQFRSDSILNSGIKRKSNFGYGDIHSIITKTYSNSNVVKVTNLLTNDYEVTTKENFNWKITNEKKITDIYNCQKAILEYGGRSWEAWFTNDIAIQDGPFKFHGLPGLITYIKDRKDNYIVELYKVEKRNKKEFNYTFSQNNKIQVSQKKLFKIFIEYYQDPFREWKFGDGEVEMTFSDKDGNKIKPDYRQMTLDEREMLIKNNNPMNLSEKINYPKNSK
ncbi:GLPGLI family protein [Epilithonimonas hominis]|uniref:GLPGLI family protein n=1 Tax=Epilithonimonas hominis TaxID=420404 RepID=A0A3N0XDS7_9FLAO|nr:GLPGLI family protein [Epilithonimonas hominis]ROI14519.1 GLPGLI family protein [Epilithonimonas hominis]